MTLKYDTAKLRRQLSKVTASWQKAITRSIGEGYVEATALPENDASELWQFVLGKSEPSRPVTGSELKREKERGDQIRQYDPKYDADRAYEASQQVLRDFGTPNLRETVQRLAARIEDDTQLAEYLTILLKLFRRPPITRAEYREAARDSDKTTKYLLWNWIRVPLRENWATANLCFYSDLAMAKLVYFRSKGKTLPAELRDKETWRIRKLYDGLGLVTADPRLIKDVEIRGGKVNWIPFKKAVLAD